MLDEEVAISIYLLLPMCAFGETVIPYPKGHDASAFWTTWHHIGWQYGGVVETIELGYKVVVGIYLIVARLLALTIAHVALEVADAVRREHLVELHIHIGRQDEIGLVLQELIQVLVRFAGWGVVHQFDIMCEVGPLLLLGGIEIGKSLEQRLESIFLDEGLHAVGEKRHGVVMAVSACAGESGACSHDDGFSFVKYFSDFFYVVHWRWSLCNCGAKIEDLWIGSKKYQRFFIIFIKFIHPH